MDHLAVAVPAELDLPTRDDHGALQCRAAEKAPSVVQPTCAACDKHAHHPLAVATPQVLEAFLIGDQEFLCSAPERLASHVWCHFESDVRELHTSECWGVLGDQESWRRMHFSPEKLIELARTILFGFRQA